MPEQERSEHVEWIKDITPDILWYYLHDIEDYSGDVVGVGVKEGKPLFFIAGYGSCSGCGEWFEYGEYGNVAAAPRDQNEVLSLCKQFANVNEAREFLEKYKKDVKSGKYFSADDFWSLNSYKMEGEVIRGFEKALVRITIEI